MSVITATSSILSQITTQIQALSASQYISKLDVLSGSSLGQHFRHIIEFYECLFFQYKTGYINYDKRQRNLTIETSSIYAKTLVESMILNLSSLDTKQHVFLETTFTIADNEKPTHVQSSIERELVYNIEHAIHHLAIVKIGIKHHYPDVKIVKNLGIAPATIKHHSNQQHAY